MLDRVGYRVDQAARNTGALKDIYPVGGCLSAQDRLQLAFKRIHVRKPCRVAKEAGVEGEVRLAQRPAQALKDSVIAGGDDQRPIGRLKRFEGSDGWMPVAHRARHMAAGDVTEHSTFQDGDLAVEHADIDLEPPAGALAMIEGS